MIKKLFSKHFIQKPDPVLKVDSSAPRHPIFAPHSKFAHLATFLGTLIFCFFAFTTRGASANSIHSIDLDVYLQSDGSAHITETWSANLSQGTEGYRTFKKLGSSKITNFSVTDDTGREYSNLSTWNTSATFDAKAYKSGYHYISGGVELCWGISKYGERGYTLTYDISNIVHSYKDGTQGVYFNFLNLDQAVGSAKITIRSDTPFTKDNSKIWAFGNSGTILFNTEKNVIELDSGASGLTKSQYMVALIQFDPKIFTSALETDETFEEIYESAMADVAENEKNPPVTSAHTSSRHVGEDIAVIIGALLFYLVPFILIFIVVKNSKWIFGSSRHSGELRFNGGKSIPKDADIPYFRELPCNKSIEHAYWVCYNYNVVPNSTVRQGLIGAIILKWLKDNQISITETKRGLFNFKDNNYALDLTRIQTPWSEAEARLLDMMQRAAGNNHILEPKEFEKWSRKHYSELQTWFYEVNVKTQKYLEDQGLITETHETVDGAFGSKRQISIKHASTTLREDAIKMRGLYRFLLDFSSMPERKFVEVKTWEEYLIFAELMGIAKKVAEQFSKVYPRFAEETNFNIDANTLIAASMARVCFEGMQTGIRRAQSSSSSGSSSGGFSSGGGGSSYSGGGSSSGGSSGGGFR